MKVYLADLANELIEMDNKSIPIGVGFIGAYCKKRFGDKVEVRIFRTFDAFKKAALADVPDIVGFGSYDWNFNLTLNTAKFVKNLNQNCYVVMGGANVEINPKDNLVFLSKHPNIDSVVYGDGEFAFAELVEAIFKHDKRDDVVGSVKQFPIDGVRSLVDGELKMGNPTNIVREVEDIPSPYLTGLFDDLLSDPNLMPILQNVRGCPYLCKYCVSGSQSGKVRHFSIDRLTAEVDYLREKAKNRVLRLSDDNFGIIEHDIEFGSHIRKSFDEYNYPVGLKAYSAKRLSDRTRRLAVILKPLMLMCISLQTTTPEVLKATKRTSATKSEAYDNLKFARENGIATATELIFGLPGETLDSMKEVINTTMDMKFDSIGMNALWLLRGADLYRPEYRDKNQYKGKFMLAENAITLGEEFTSLEWDEIAVESNSYSFDEWQRFLGYEFLLKLSYYYGYARELIIHAHTCGIATTDIFDEILDHSHLYPAASSVATQYIKKYTENMHDSPEELHDYIMEQVEELKGDKEAIVSLSKTRMVYSFIAEMFFNDENHSFLTEFFNAIVHLYDGTKRIKFEKSANALLSLSRQLIVNPRKPFVSRASFESEFDIPSWIREGYKKPLWNYHLSSHQSFDLISRNDATVRSAMERDNIQNRSDGYNFFRYMNSSLMRRIIVRRGNEILSKPIVGQQQEPHVVV